MLELELLSPAKDKAVGIAAIDCGADSVYIAAPKYGARSQAGNSFEDIEKLCSYAHGFGAKVYLTLNTILFDNEIEEAELYLWEAYKAGIDAVIVQDFGILKMNRPPIPLFASTQTDIRTPEKAALLEALGFERLILARELSLKQIAKIKNAVSVPLESFVHGALCVSYSGQCYLSQSLAQRSANRGMCAQPCRSNYDLVDENGKVLVKDTPLLSLKDMNRISRLGDLMDAGVDSFKIEGRLKNISYVKNIVSLYSQALDKIIAEKNRNGEQIRRSSFGRSRCAFNPDAGKTFNRGYTEFFLDGKREDFKSRDAAKNMGEYIGTVAEVKGGGTAFVSFTYTPAKDGQKEKRIHNSDGLCFVSGGKISSGYRASRCLSDHKGRSENYGVELFTKEANIKKGDRIYRNFDAGFEKQIEKTPSRIIDVELDVFLSESHITVSAYSDRFKTTFTLFLPGERAENKELAQNLVKNQLGKTSGHFSFSVNSVDGDDIYFYRTSALNAIRAELADTLEKYLEESRKKAAKKSETTHKPGEQTTAENLVALAQKAFAEDGKSYLRNCSNRLAESVYRDMGMDGLEPSYEQQPQNNAVLMRCKYCIRYQLGLCPDDGKKLFLKNGDNTLALEFDCRKCEMTVKLHYLCLK